MHLNILKRTWALLAAIALGAAGITVPAAAQEKPMAPMATFDKTGAVIVSIGGQSRFQMKSKKPIKEAFNENDRTVQVLADANDPSTLILIGRAAGTSKLELKDAAGGSETYLVVVQRDMELLRSLIRKTVPTASVEVTPIGDNGNSVILAGYAAREDDRDTVRALAEALGLRVAVNHVTVGGGGNVPHVQLDLTLAKVDRSRARSRGANFIFNGGTISGGSLLGGLSSTQAGGGGGGAGGAGGSVGLIPSAATAIAGSGANLIFGVVPSNFQALLGVLKVEGLAKLVAAPTIVARSGEQGTISVGGEVPTISASSGITGPGVTGRQVGTQLTCTPIVYGNGKIYLDINIEITTVNQTLALVTTFGTAPGFDVQRMRTSILVEPGQTVALGGLIQTNQQGSINKIPLLGDIPYLGTMFSYATQTEQETEMVVVVTPRLIDAADSSQMPRPLPGSETRKPDDFEFFLETMLEAPRGQRAIWAGHHYQPAWKSSNTAGTYPCVGGNCATPVVGTAPAGNCATGNCPAPAVGVNTPDVPVSLPEKFNATPVKNPAPLPIPKTPTSLPPVTDLSSPVDVPPAPIPQPGQVTLNETADPIPAAILAPVTIPGRSVATSPAK